MLNTLQGADIELASFPRQHRLPPPLNYTDVEARFIELEIQKLLSKDVIRSCEHEQGDFVSNIFLRDKKDGSYRMILNLKKLNESLGYEKFKMECLTSALDLVSQGCYMASIDLKDAYYSVPIAQRFWRYLKFQYGGQFYSFTCLPNGLSPGPRLFTKLLKPVFGYLRQMGFMNTVYIDDSLLIGTDHAECEANVKHSVEALRHAGFAIHPDKSSFIPQTKIQYIGFIIDSVNMTISLPEEKMIRIRDNCRSMLNTVNPTIQMVAELVGQLVAAVPAVELGKVFYRRLDIDKSEALKANQGRFEARMNLSKEARSDLKWWIRTLPSASRSCQTKPTSLIIHSDASDSGWGGAVLASSLSTGGQWNRIESLMHINKKELIAAFHSLQSFASDLTDAKVNIQIDNTTAAAYINNEGGRKRGCNELARGMALWAHARRLEVTATYLPGVLNVKADKMSRITHDNMEWKLDSSAFHDVTQLWDVPDIDLFASRLNAQLDRYVSWKHDPGASHVDAFTLPWATYSLAYAFPPFSCISRSLKKIRDDAAEAVIVVPRWTSQPWFPLLLRMLTDDVFLFPRNILSCHHKHQPPPDNLRLMACRVSGKAMLSSQYRHRLSGSSVTRGRSRRGGSTAVRSNAGRPLQLGLVRIPTHQLHAR